jgi:hypothetical protein
LYWCINSEHHIERRNTRFVNGLEEINCVGREEYSGGGGGDFGAIYRVIQEELPLLTELISDILSKKYHVNLGPIHSIYRVTFVFGNTLL